MEKVIQKYKLAEEPNDLAYWLSKTPQERLAALEVLRQRYVKFFLNGNRQGFQRIYSTRQLKQS
jgi:hypothetical protein